MSEIAKTKVLEIKSALDCALLRVSKTDNQTVVGHVRDAHKMLCQLLGAWPGEPAECDQCSAPMDGPHHPGCYRYFEPPAERWMVGKNGWDASDEATREDI